VSAFNPLVTFYNIYEKGELLFFWSESSTTRDYPGFDETISRFFLVLPNDGLSGKVRFFLPNVVQP
jgi:hypothetical protein